MSGIVAIPFQLDKNTDALAATDQAMLPSQGAGSVAGIHAIQDGYIRGIDCEVESAQSDGDDVTFSVYVGGTRDDDSEVTVAGAGSSAGATYGTSRFDRGDAITTPPATSNPVSMPISSDTAEPTAEDFWLLPIPPTGLAIQVSYRKAILSDFRRVRPRNPPRSN